MRSIGLLAAIGIAASALAATPAAAQNLLTNGSFESRIVTAADTCQGGAWCVRSFASTPGWTQFGDGVDLVNNNYTQAPGFDVLVDASDGVNFLDMNQAGAAGGIFQVVSATAGQLFHLSLDTAAWAINGRGGTLGYQLYDPTSNAVLASGSFTDPTGGTWINRTLDAAAVSNQIGVRIQTLFATQAGPGLDNVVLTASTPGAVPEPAAWAMMLIGFGMLGSVLRRHPVQRVRFV
ncbi:MAG: PEPxxWA-CTERM sorting domain-containing protein [Proteobacteria bacterium]|nr:PEPxxWA-CTERM sorting domain-containing protein [Pseudomonadota bacterium]